MSTEEGTEGIPLDDVTMSDEGLLDSDEDEVKGQQDGEFPDVGELDYDELMENEGNEDEVKVHVAEDIEEGEVTSDEEGEIKESDDDEEDGEATHTATPTKVAQSDTESGQLADSIEKDLEQDRAEEKAAKKQTRKEEHSSDEGSGHSSEERDGAKGGRVKRSGGDGGRSGEGVDKVSTVCRHFLSGKCNWGSSCRFTHDDPIKERSKLPPHDRRGGPADFHGGPLDGPWMARGLPPPHFMHGPMGPPRDLLPHMDPRGPMPLPPPGRGGYVPPHVPPYGPMHSRDMPPGRHFDPMGRRGMDGRRPPYPPFNETGRGGRKNISEVAEETEGWMRLRTVTHDYSSDEEQDRVKGDLRDRIKTRRGQEGDSDSERSKRPHPPRGPDDWSDPWARDIKRDRLSRKKRKKTSSSEESSSESEPEIRQKKVKGRKRSESSVDSSDSDEESVKKKKKKVKKAKKQTTSSEPSSDSEEDTKRKKRSTKEASKKRKKKSRDESSEEEAKKKRKKKSSRHMGTPSPPADPRRYHMREDYFPPPPPFPPHLSPEDRRHWPPHPHTPHPLDYPPPTSHHPRDPHHSPKTDQFGRDITKRLDYEDSRRHRHGDRPIPPPYDYPPPPHRPGRDHPLWDPRRRPHSFNEGHKRRRSSEDASGSPTPPANPDSDLSEEESGRGPRGRNKKSHKASDDGLTRKEKLLQELQAINKSIEKKKSKKRYH